MDSCELTIVNDHFQVVSGGYVIFTTPLCDSFVELVNSTNFSIIQIQKVMKCICLKMGIS